MTSAHDTPENRMETAAGERLTHPFDPIWRPDARVLILGSFPSVRSRAEGFYYGHPRNRFWKLLSSLYREALPETTAQKTDLLLRHRLALWDVLRLCRITGSADAAIRDAEPNDIPGLLAKTQITCVLANGQTAAQAYRQAGFSMPLTVLPSTSPANAAWSPERLAEVWGNALRKEGCL